MKQKLIISIDPGAHGALAGIGSNGGVWTYNFNGEESAYDALSNALESANNDNAELVCYLEQVGGFIGKQQPGSAMFNFGKNFGYWLGLLKAMRIRTVLVRPQVWQKGVVGVAGKQGAERKRALRDAASRAFPAVKVTLANADALMLLDYASKQEK